MKKQELFSLILSQAEGNMLVVDPDILKNIQQDYDENNHQSYIQKSDELFLFALSNETSRKQVLYTAGGSGSGKTEIILKNYENIGFNGLVCDCTLSHFERYSKHIDRTLFQNKEVIIHGILTDIPKAYKHVLLREKRTGRAVPMSAFIRTHIGFISTFPKIIQKYSQNPKLSFRLLDSREEEEVIEYRDVNLILEEMSKISYNQTFLEAIISEIKI